MMVRKNTRQHLLALATCWAAIVCLACQSGVASSFQIAPQIPRYRCEHATTVCQSSNPLLSSFREEKNVHGLRMTSASDEDDAHEAKNHPAATPESLPSDASSAAIEVKDGANKNKNSDTVPAPDATTKRTILLAVPLFCKFVIVLVIKFLTDLVVFPLLFLYRGCRLAKRRVIGMFQKEKIDGDDINGLQDFKPNGAAKPDSSL